MLQYIAFRRFTVILLESFLLVCCVLGAFFVRIRQSPFASPDRNEIMFKAALIALVFQLFLHLRDIYDFRTKRRPMEFALRLGQALLMASALLWILYYLLPVLVVGRGVFLLALLFSSIFIVIWHTARRVYLGTRSPRSNVLVVGTGRLARELVQAVLHTPEYGYRICGFVDHDADLVGTSIINPKVIGMARDVAAIVDKHKIDRIVVELQDRRGRLPIDDLLKCKMRGVAVEDATTFYERVTGKIAIENLKPSWMIFNAGFEVSPSLLIQKRLLSILFSSLLLILTSPVILIVIILIKLDSRGPVLFSQKRVGQDGCIFTLWKFRSMRENAEGENGAVWASENDNRVTRVGRFLRRMRLDELPQLYNVLRGDMSLVGPRPERPEFVSQLAATIPFYHLRHAVKPGITGWAQINYGYANSVAHTTEKLQYDLFYVKNASLLLDLLIILETVKTVLVRKGS